MSGPLDYSSPSVFEEEYRRVFSRRSFVQFSRAFLRKNSYYSFSDFGRPVTVRCDGENQYLISNVCLHRASVIDPPGMGDRPFTCGYHGWTYSNAGILCRAPLLAIDSIRQRELPIQKLVDHHGLLFRDSSCSLDDEKGFWLSGGAEIGDVYFQSELRHEANWKLLVENVLESYHISVVHGGSFSQIGLSSESRSRTEYYGCSSSFELFGADQPFAVETSTVAAMPRYRHVFIFPNLFLSWTDNAVGFLGWLVPISSSATMLRWCLFEGRGMNKLRPAARDVVRASSVDFAHRVLQEDLNILSLTQMGAGSGGRAYQLQKMESRISHFHETYTKLMGQ